MSRRRLLVALALVPPALAACSTGRSAAATPDPRIALADAARADVRLIAAAIAARPDLAPTLDPLRTARADHATALDAALGRPPASTSPAPHPTAAGPVGTPQVQAAIATAARSASTLVTTLPVDQVGLVASIAACCAAYAADL